MKKGLYLIFIALIVILILPSVEVKSEDMNYAPKVPLSPSKTNMPILSKPLTLTDCYILALHQSEVIAINEEFIKEAEAHFLQYLGPLLPQVNFVWNDARLSSSGQTNNIESKFVFRQTLFSGFKEFAGLDISRFEKEQYLQQKQRAEQLLFVDVADAFYLLLEEQEDLKVLGEIQEAFNDRVVELKKREEIGRSRQSEVVNTEAQLYNIEAEIETDKSQKSIAIDLLEFLTGKPIEQIIDEGDTPDSMLDEDVYVSKSYSRPDVKAAEYVWDMAKKQINLARSDLFPTVSVEADDYTQRLPTDPKWEAFLEINVPIFEGTTTYGAIKNATAQARASELQFNRTQRLASQDIHDSYFRAITSITRNEALEKALKAAELNSSLQKQDYQYNLVNNLDVLTAIQDLGNTKRNYIQSLYEKKRFYWELQAAIGEVPTNNQNQ